MTRFLVALGLLALACVSSAGAQSPPPDAPAAPSPPAPAGAEGPSYPKIYQAPLFGSLFAAAPSEPPVDESGLRYYASQHDVKRTEAEIRRLKALHPNWTPPANIYAPAGSGNDEQPFWDLFAADRLEELHAGIALRERKEPGWKPSRELAEKLKRKEAINALVSATNSGRWNEALEIADDEPSILHCAYMDADWRVADAFLNVGSPSRAFEIYHAILASCADHNERLATVRKAISRFPVDEVKQLIAMGASNADGAGEFDAARIDLTRSRISAVNAGKSVDAIEPSALDEYFADVERTRDRDDLSLAGWYEYGLQAYAPAEHWFQLGAPARPTGDETDAKFAQGRALSLVKLGRSAEALKLAWDWRDASPQMRDLYVDAMIEELTRPDGAPELGQKDIADFIEVVAGDKSFAGAEALAWRNLTLRDFEAAALWFKTALAYRGLDPLAPPDKVAADDSVLKTIEGDVLALDKLDRAEEAADVAETWRGFSPRLGGLFIDVVTELIDREDRAQPVPVERMRRYAETTAALRSVVGAKKLGWLQLREGAWNAAIDWFSSAIEWSPDGKGDDKTNEGFALALKSAGRLPEAETIAWAWRERSRELRALYVATMVEELATPAAARGLNPARIERFARLVSADRSAEGAKALGWRNLSDWRCAFAAPWFREAMNWTADRSGDPEANKGLAQALRAVGRFQEADEIAYSWRDRAPEMRALYTAIAAEELTREWPVAAMSEDRMARFAEIVLADHSVVGAEALGWRRYRQTGSGYGGRWFELASIWLGQKGPDEKIDEGRALALQAVGKLAEAAALARAWADKDDQMKALFIEIVAKELSRDNPPEPIDEGRLEDFVQIINPIRSAPGAEALGWYRYARGEYGEAATWFDRAAQWQPPETEAMSTGPVAAVEDYKPILAKLALSRADYRRTPRAYLGATAAIGQSGKSGAGAVGGQERAFEGYALSLRALGRVEEAEAIAFQRRDRWPAMRKLFVDIAVAELGRDDGPPISEERIERYRAAIDADHAYPGAEAFGWRAFRHTDYAAAATWFKTALDWREADQTVAFDPKLAEAYIASLRRAKRLNEALEAAVRYRDAAPSLRSVYYQTALEALRDSSLDDAQGAARLSDLEGDIEERRSSEGATAVGWLAYDRKDFPQALVWFKKAVAWRGEDKDGAEALEGLALALCATSGNDEYCSFAYAWRDATPALKEIYLGAMISWLTGPDAPREMPPDTLAKFEAFVSDERSVEGAQAIGWRFARAEDWKAALAWFRAAIDWGEIDPLRPGESADGRTFKIVEGYVQALRGADALGEAEDVAFAWSARAANLRALYFQIVVQSLNDAASAPGLSDARVLRFAKLTLDEKSVVGAQNLGWLAYRAKSYGDAVDWFEKTIQWSPDGKADPKTYEGYGLSLLGARRFADAEAVAWTWRGQSKELSAVFIAAVAAELEAPELAAKVDLARLERFAEIVVADQSPVGAAALAWLKMRDAACADALPWFRRAARWSADGIGDAKTNEGLAQSLFRLGRFNEAEDAAFAWADRSADMRALYIKIGVEELTREWPHVAMSQARIERYLKLAEADRSSVAMQALGWRRYGEAGEGFAGQWFKLAALWSADGRGDAKLNEGYALALRAVGRGAAAEEIAYPWVATTPAMKKLYIDTFVDELSRDNPPEPIDEPRIRRFIDVIEPLHSALGAQALGWYRYERGETKDAVLWFKNALDWWPHPKDAGDKALIVPVDEYAPILAKLALVRADYRRTPRAYASSSLLNGQAQLSVVDTPEGLAKTVLGLALALRAAGRVLDAEALAYEWRDRWPPLKSLFLDIAVEALSRGDAEIDAERLARFSAVIAEEKSAAGALALAWRSYRAKSFDDASTWFQSALDWKDPKAQLDAHVVEGYAMALRGAKKLNAAAALIATYAEKLPSLKDQAIDIALDEIAGLDPASPDAAGKLAKLAANVSEARSARGAAAIGWIAYRRKEFPAAVAWFKQAIVWAEDRDKPDPKALEGMALSLAAQGRTQDAVTFAGEWSRRIADLKPIFVDLAAEALVAPPTDGVELKDDAIARAAAIFAELKSERGAQALGWQRTRVKDYVAAAAWFKAAILWSSDGAGDAKTVEGLLIALRGEGAVDEAEALAYSWAKRDDTLRSVYIEIVAERLARRPPAPPDEAEMRRFADVVFSANSAGGAEALGWFSYNTRQLRAAASWFEKALAWEPSENAAFGLALTFRAMDDREDYARVLARYRLQYGRIDDLAAGRSPRAVDEFDRRAALEKVDAPASAPGGAPPVSAQKQAEAEDGFGDAFAPVRPRAANGAGHGLGFYLSRKDYVGCLRRAEALAASGALSAADMNARGWCLMNSGRPEEAIRSFDGALKAAQGAARDDAAYGKSLALLQSGRSREAAAAAGDGDLSYGRRNEIGVAVLAQRANDAYQAGRYKETLHWLDERRAFAPETRDLMALRAWSLQKLGHSEAAADIFRSLDSQLSTDETRAGLGLSGANP